MSIVRYRGGGVVVDRVFSSVSLPLACSLSPTHAIMYHVDNLSIEL